MRTRRSHRVASYHDSHMAGQDQRIVSGSATGRRPRSGVALQDHYAEYESLDKEFASISAWMTSISASFEAQTAVMKYTHETRQVFPSEMRPEQDWAFFNDPSHPHFALLESTIASRAYRSQVIKDFYSSTIPKIEALIKQISEALRKG